MSIGKYFPNKSLLEERKKLPIWQHKSELVNTIKSNRNCIIVSSTGTGKSTQLPQFLLEAGLAVDGVIAISQPRRIAAITVAQRVAEELGHCPVGQGSVGYCVRFEDVSDIRLTRLRYMTDGMLLREAILDPLLSRYSIIIVDEAHERSLNTELLLGVVLNASRRRAGANRPFNNAPSSKACKPLKIIVMSATIDPNLFVKFLGPDHTRVVYIEGRRFPIKILSALKPSSDYVADAATTCMQLHKVKNFSFERGILIFLTGEDEIRRCVSLIRHLYRSSVSERTKTKNNIKAFGLKNNDDLVVFPLFASLPEGQQMTAISFTKPNVRKVVVSTNISETSVTIPGIQCVIDCGRAKFLERNSTTGLDSLRVRWISKSQAWQRAGRAGRYSSGVCFRLYSDEEYSRMPLHPISQLLHSPFDGVLLNLLSMGIHDVLQFPWLQRPQNRAIESGCLLLSRLGAVSCSSEFRPTSDSSSQPSLPRSIQLTKLGKLMTAFPLQPRLGRALLSAANLGCLVEAIIAVSMLYVSPIFYVPEKRHHEYDEVVQRFRHPSGDLATLILVYRAYIKSNSSPKSSRIDSADLCSVGSIKKTASSRKKWCRENFVIFSRLATAVRVRNQLKSVTIGSGIGSLTSCGEDMSLLLKAFFEVAFRDQVAILSARDVDIVATKQQTFPTYTLLNATELQQQQILSIHPDSHIYSLSVSSRCPPSSIFFIEAIDANSNIVPEDCNNITADRHMTSQRILLRYVNIVPHSWLALPARSEPSLAPSFTVRENGLDCITQSSLKRTAVSLSESPVISKKSAVSTQSHDNSNSLQNGLPDRRKLKKRRLKFLKKKDLAPKVNSEN